MDERELKQIRLELTEYSKAQNEQGATLALLLATVKLLAEEGKVSFQKEKLEQAVDKLNIHPIAAASVKSQAKKLIPVYFP